MTKLRLHQAVSYKCKDCGFVLCVAINGGQNSGIRPDWEGEARPTKAPPFSGSDTYPTTIYGRLALKRQVHDEFCGRYDTDLPTFDEMVSHLTGEPGTSN